MFNGNIEVNGSEKTSLSDKALLLRGAKLMNTQWVYGVVVYSGHETKLLMNSTKAPLKRSSMEKMTNYQIIFLFLMLIAISLVSAVCSEMLGYNGEDHTYVTGGRAYKGSNFFLNFLTFFILYHNMIPISLQVTLEFVKFFQAYYINWVRPSFIQSEWDLTVAREHVMYVSWCARVFRTSPCTTSRRTRQQLRARRT